MMKSIESVINDYIQLCSDYGLSQSTVDQKRYRYCQPIADFFATHGQESFDEELLTSYLKNYEIKLSNNQISQKYFNAIKKTVMSLVSVALTGTAPLGRLCVYKRFLISDDLEQIIDNILNQVDYNPDYRYKHACCLRKFFYYLNEADKDIFDINNQDVIAYITEVARKTNAGSMSYVINSLHLLIRWLRQQSATIDIDVKTFHPKALPKRIINPFSKSEIVAIINSIDVSNPIGKRDLAIILLSYTTGLRAVDICQLCLQDIDWKRQVASIYQSKTLVHLTVPIPGYVLNKIADYILHARPVSDCQEIFLTSRAPFHGLKNSRSIDQRFESYCHMPGVEKQSLRSFHSLRRSFATELSQKQTDVTLVSQLLGHTTFTSARRYLSYNDITLKECAAGFNEVPIQYGVYDNNYLPPVSSVSKTGDVSDFYSEVVESVPLIQGGVYGQ